MQKIKLVLTDVDGTLVPVLKDEPSEKVKQTVAKVQNLGIEIAAVTGRPYEMMQKLFNHIGFHDLCVVDAGASIRRVKTGEIVWKNWIDIERLKSIAEILLPVSTLIDFFPEWREGKPETLSVEDIVSDAPYVFAFVKEEYKAQVLEGLKRVSRISVHIQEAHKEWEGLLNIQIVDETADKYHAVMALRKILDIDQDHTLAIGDSSNDLPLLKAAGTKVAMGNAIDSLKQLADHVVASVDEDGFAEAMEKFVLNHT